MSTLPADSPPLALGHWVEVVTQPSRRGDRVVLINPRDDTALATTADDLAHTLAGAPTSLRDDLVALGFTDDGVTVNRPRGLRHALRTSEVAWYGADRLARRLAVTLRPLWSSRLAIIGQVGLAVAGVFAVVSLSRSLDRLELRPEPAQLPIVLLLSLIAIAIHELAHAVAVAHHGRTVSALGLRLHLGSPTFYCDSAAALALGRRQRIIHAFAGPWAEWLFTAAFALVVVCLPTTWATPILLRFVLLNTYNVASNLLPFGRLDGALILSDLVDEPDLPDESRRAFGRLVRGERRPGDRRMSAYAIADQVVSGALTIVSIVLWWELFGGVLVDAATGGIVERALLVTILLVVFGPAVGTSMQRLRSIGPVDRAWFRLERRTRVRSVRALVAAGAVGTSSAHTLGVLAGRVEIVRLWWGDRLTVPHFAGRVISATGSVEGCDGRPLGATVGVHEPVERGCTLVGRMRPCTTFVLVPSAP